MSASAAGCQSQVRQTPSCKPANSDAQRRASYSVSLRRSSLSSTSSTSSLLSSTPSSSSCPPSSSLPSLSSSSSSSSQKQLKGTKSGTKPGDVSSIASKSAAANCALSPDSAQRPTCHTICSVPLVSSSMAGSHLALPASAASTTCPSTQLTVPSFSNSSNEVEASVIRSAGISHPTVKVVAEAPVTRLNSGGVASYQPERKTAAPSTLSCVSSSPSCLVPSSSSASSNAICMERLELSETPAAASSIPTSVSAPSPG